MRGSVFAERTESSAGGAEVSNKRADAGRTESRRQTERADQYIMVRECVSSINYSGGRKYYVTSTVTPCLLGRGRRKSQ